MINAKKKGNAGENNFANWLREQGVCKGYRNSSSGSNTVKSDINNDIDINFEVKTVKALNLQKAFRQSERDAFSSHSKPYVVVHFDGMPKDKWLIVMDNWEWLELIKKQEQSETRGEIIKEDSYNMRTAKYKLTQAKELIRQAEKIINNEV